VSAGQEQCGDKSLEQPGIYKHFLFSYSHIVNPYEQPVQKLEKDTFPRGCNGTTNECEEEICHEPQRN